MKVGKKPAELYDLAADIGEATDLADKKTETAAALQTQLDAWNATLVAPKWQSPQQPKKKK